MSSKVSLRDLMISLTCSIASETTDCFGDSPWKDCGLESRRIARGSGHARSEGGVGAVGSAGPASHASEETSGSLIGSGGMESTEGGSCVDTSGAVVPASGNIASTA